ncbi:hypothetical protein EDC40_11110 [Aminobacter aminovorans]|uniref:Uncharacterized protein n=1 Tax=Aminobacter aminovorans TaxID=83263 RepID=A0A380WRB8_AMIAI|nr:hypothetical protein EDC40_11110 [Aminobacter aminovorans]SUU91507.1 Uncharacterised protein [Aminobacter aminovorans]
MHQSPGPGPARAADICGEALVVLPALPAIAAILADISLEVPLIDAFSAANHLATQARCEEHRLDSIEKAIRNAFEKGDPENREFREKVYRAAFGALDRALKANPAMTVEAAIGRRKSLQAKITEIESEFMPAAPSVSLGQAGAASVPEISLNGNGATTAPSISIGTPAAGVTPVVPDIMPDAVLPDGPPVEITEKRSRAERRAADRASARAERRRPYAAMFFAVTLLAMGGIGAWWAVQTGQFKSAAEIDTSVHNPPKQLESEDFSPNDAGPARPGEVDQARNWITVFTPTDPTDVSAPSGTSAEVAKDDTGTFLRIRSGDTGSAIVFDVGRGVLEQIAGKHAVFDIIARAEDGKETQMAVDCNFGELGDCGRKRYLVGYQRGEYLFEMDVPDKEPGAAGTIAINSDLGKEGKAVDIYEIRVSVTE